MFPPDIRDLDGQLLKSVGPTIPNFDLFEIEIRERRAYQNLVSAF